MGHGRSKFVKLHGLNCLRPAGGHLSPKYVAEGWIAKWANKDGRATSKPTTTRAHQLPHESQDKIGALA